MEVWKDIDGFNGYQISTWGNVRNRKGQVLKPYYNSKGYLKIGLTKNGKCHKKRINRLVAMAFIPNPYNFPQVNHKDGNKENNSVTNLEWTTNEINNKHSKLMQKGEILF